MGALYSPCRSHPEIHIRAVRGHLPSHTMCLRDEVTYSRWVTAVVVVSDQENHHQNVSVVLADDF